MVPENVFSQTEYLVVDTDKEVSLKTLFKTIKEQTDYRFIYRADLAKGLPSITLTKGRVKLSEILNAYLPTTDFTYTFLKGKTIVLRPREEPREVGLTESVTDQARVSGTISDASGMPLPGASIVEKGTTNGTQSDFDGNFELSVADGNATLVISYVGFVTQEIALAGRTDLNISLKENAAELDEVVVVGYGQQSTKSVTGSVFKVGQEQFESRPQTTAIQALQGAVPGLLVTRTGGGRAGREGNQLQIRGETSGPRSQAGVLIVIDGIVQPEQNASALQQINPYDIESITVLRDAQAAIYGARAAGGVILVTTKKGRSEKPVFKYSGNFSINKIGRHNKAANPSDFYQFNDAAFVAAESGFRPYQELAENFANGTYVVNDGQIVPGPFSDVPFVSTNYIDWVDELYGGSRLMQTHNFSVSGTSKRSNYYVSVGIVDQEGQLRPEYGNNNNLRQFARTKLSFDATDKLKLSTNFYGERQVIEEPNSYESGQELANGVWSNQLPFTPEGNYLNYGGFQSPVAYTKGAGDLEDEFYRANLQFGAVYTPVENLAINGDFSINVNNENRTFLQKIVGQYNLDDTFSFFAPNRTRAGNSNRKSVHRVANLFANYVLNLDKTHNFNLTVGASHEEFDVDDFSASRFDLVSDALPALGLGDPEEQATGYSGTHWSLNSQFGRFKYDHKGKYIFESNVRRDVSSRFAEEFRDEVFVGSALAWIASNESFLQSAEFLDLLKFRVSYGELGNQVNTDDSRDNFRFKTFVDISGIYPFGPASNPSQVLSARISGGQLAAPDRKWETTRIKNIGLDFGLFSNLSGSFNYFEKKTSDILVSLEYPEVLGVSPPLTNGGSLKTTGWDLALNWNDTIGNGFNYGITFVISNDTNEVLNLEDSRVATNGINDYTEGYSTNTFFALAFDGVIQTEAELEAYRQLSGAVPGNIGLGSVRYKDMDGDGVLEPGTLYMPGNEESGDMIPVGFSRIQYPYSFTFNADYKGFDFSMFWQGVGKWNVVRPDTPPGSAWWQNPKEHFIGNTWTPENTDAIYPIHTSDNLHGYNYQNSNAPYRWTDNKYLRLKNLQFGYQLPEKLTAFVGVSNARVYFSGNDLFEFTNIDGDFDPETYSTDNTPIFRSYSFGIDLTF
jgi:TonB-linked SusC/RagA family outer membrane protein